MYNGTLISGPHTPKKYKFSGLNRCGSAVRTKELVKKFGKFTAKCFLKNSIVVLAELRGAERFCKKG